MGVAPAIRVFLTPTPALPTRGRGKQVPNLVPVGTRPLDFTLGGHLAHEIRIEKLMSLTLAEFQLTIAPLAGGPLAPHVSAAEVPLGTGRVVIHYDPRPSVRFGGLLDLPRALVSLTFTGVLDQDRLAFLKRFELAFQRGGG